MKLNGGRRGAFQKLLQRFPEILDMIDRHLRQKSFRLNRGLHSNLLNYLRKQGLTNDDYPFNTLGKGYGALCRHVSDFKARTETKKYIAKRGPKPGGSEIFELDAGPPWEICLNRHISQWPEDQSNSAQTRLKRVQKSKRLSRAQKIALAVKIRDAAIKFLESHGSHEMVYGHLCLLGHMSGMEILHSTPFTGREGAPAPYGLDIWDRTQHKVFNIIWDPVDIVTFKYGPWMNDFVPESYLP